MAKLYIEIDTNRPEDLALLTLGRKGLTVSLADALEVIDQMAGDALTVERRDDFTAEQASRPMISRLPGEPVVGAEFEVTTALAAIEAAERRVQERLALAVQEGDPLIISALHTGENERGN